MERSTDQSAAKTADRRGKVSKTEDDVRRQKKQKGKVESNQIAGELERARGVSGIIITRQDGNGTIMLSKSRPFMSASCS
jgi:hypothetical protein